MRTIVVSDAHGHVELIENALDDAAFDPECDGLIYAGDLVDGDLPPEGPAECLEFLERYDAQVLWGNHDMAVLLDYPMAGQRRDTRPAFKKRFRREFERQGRRRWRLVTVTQGVLVSHAGVAVDYEAFGIGAGAGPTSDAAYVERLARALNAAFDHAVWRQLSSGARDEREVMFARRSPNRFRPHEWGPDDVLRGVVQVAGHSAEELYGGRWQAQDFADVGLYLIDPSYHHRGCTAGCRYAVVAHGMVDVHEAMTAVDGRGRIDELPERP